MGLHFLDCYGFVVDSGDRVLRYQQVGGALVKIPLRVVWAGNTVGRVVSSHKVATWPHTYQFIPVKVGGVRIDAGCTYVKVSNWMGRVVQLEKKSEDGNI